MKAIARIFTEPSHLTLTEVLTLMGWAFFLGWCSHIVANNGMGW